MFHLRGKLDDIRPRLLHRLDDGGACPVHHAEKDKTEENRQILSIYGKFHFTHYKIRTSLKLTKPATDANGSSTAETEKAVRKKERPF